MKLKRIKYLDVCVWKGSHLILLSGESEAEEDTGTFPV